MTLLDISLGPLAYQLVHNPINWLLLLLFTFLLFQWFKGSPDLPPPPQVHPKMIELRDFTRQELLDFNGEKGKEIYIGVKGWVFDVTRSSHFYGPGEIFIFFCKS